MLAYSPGEDQWLPILWLTSDSSLIGLFMDTDEDDDLSQIILLGPTQQTIPALPPPPGNQLLSVGDTATAVPSTCTLLSIVNRGDGLYYLTFSEPVSPTIDATENAILMFSPGQAAWVNITWLGYTDPTIQTVQAGAGNGDCTIAACAMQFQNASAADPLNITAQPLPLV